MNSTPVFDETIGEALIDAARINVMAALQAFPLALGIVLPGVGVGDSEEPGVADCLAQAMEWLNVARALTLEGKPPPTSLHLVGMGGGS